MTNTLSLGLLELLLKGGLILGVGHVLLVVLRRRSAALRAFLWSALFVSLFFLPLTLGFAPRWSLGSAWRAADAPGASVGAGELKLRVREIDSREPGRPDGSAAPTPYASASRPTLAQGFIALWLVGAGVMLGLTLRDHLRLRRMARACVPLRDEALVTEARAEAEALGYTREFRLVQLSQNAVPLVWGLWRPTLALPAGAHDWNEAWRRAALRHELAHLLRRDPWWRAFGALVIAVHWMNPLAWVAARRWRLAQEQACDDLALAGTRVEAASYAEQLLGLARRRELSPAAALGMATRRSPIGRRVRAVVNATQERAAPKMSALAASSGTVLALFAASAFTGIAAPVSADSTDSTKALTAVQPVSVPAKSLAAKLEESRIANEQAAKQNVAAAVQQLKIELKFLDVPTEAIPAKLAEALKPAFPPVPFPLAEFERLPNVDLLQAPTISSIAGREVEASIGQEIDYVDAGEAKKTELIGITLKALPTIEGSTVSVKLSAKRVELDGFLDDGPKRTPVLARKTVNSLVSFDLDAPTWLAVGVQGDDARTTVIVARVARQAPLGTLQ